MKSQGIPYKKLAVSVIGTLILFIAAVAFLDTITFFEGIKKLGWPLLRLSFFILMGLTAGQAIETLGWTRQVAVLARPLFRFSNLGHRCSASFTTAFLSGAAANAMLFDFYKEDKINKLQLFLTNYINQFPMFFLHLPTTIFIVLPLTGYAGVLYFSITFLATLFRTICFLFFGYLYPGLGSAAKNNNIEMDSNTADRKESPGLGQLFKTIKSKLPGRITRIMVWVLPIYTFVFILNTHGFFEYLNRSMAQYLALEILPVESLGIVILSFAAEFTSGFAAAGALMDAGVLNVKQTVIALLLGNILAFPIRALRHQLPRYMGIFSPKMGLQLLLSGQFFRITSLVFVGLIYYLVTP
ncbi:MAG: nucleoside recognition protein [Desulfobacteraceae bacterium]|nr:nucleoside recognition protein [Desulfobacteraceae bacterium]